MPDPTPPAPLPDPPAPGGNDYRPSDVPPRDPTKARGPARRAQG